jgi:hypothetical protein
METMTTDTARAVLHDLETKLASARTRHDETQAEAQSIAFAAHTGDADARKRLDRLNADAGKRGAEVLSLEAAIVEARSRVALALAAEGDRAERDRAEKALGLLDDFAARGARLDAALAGFVAEYEALTADFYKLDALGFAPATHALIEMNLRRATATRLMFTGLRQSFPAPNERRDFVTVIAGWAQHVRARATARLNRNAAAKAA